jgi:hypothetical protein
MDDEAVNLGPERFLLDAARAYDTVLADRIERAILDNRREIAALRDERDSQRRIAEGWRETATTLRAELAVADRLKPLYLALTAIGIVVGALAVALLILHR